MNNPHKELYIYFLHGWKPTTIEVIKGDIYWWRWEKDTVLNYMGCATFYDQYALR